MPAIRAAILDVDGTLVDSNDAHARAWEDAFREHGHDISFEEVRPLIGMGGDKLIPKVSGFEESSPQGQEVNQTRRRIFKERYLPHIRAFPLVPELLGRMKKEGLTLVVATSAEESEAKALLEIAGARDLIDARTSSDDAEESKPEPDIVQAALEASGCASREVIMLGDTPYDIEAAKRSGVAIIGLTCGGWPADRLAGTVAVYESPADLLQHFDESPLRKP